VKERMPRAIIHQHAACTGLCTKPQHNTALLLCSCLNLLLAELAQSPQHWPCCMHCSVWLANLQQPENTERSSTAACPHHTQHHATSTHSLSASLTMLLQLAHEAPSPAAA
jgi:hypothetical protein